jgi:hypothetical protein
LALDNWSLEVDNPDYSKKLQGGDAMTDLEVAVIPAKPKVVVLGDIAWQYILTPSKQEKNQFVRHTDWIGAPLIQKMITNAINEKDSPISDDGKKSVSSESAAANPDTDFIAAPSYGNLEKDRASAIQASAVFIADLGYFPKASGGSKKDQEKNQVLRLARDVRTQTEKKEDSGSTATTDSNYSFEKALSGWISSANADQQTLAVIYDRDLDLRKPAALTGLKAFLNDLKSGDSVVIAIEGNITDEHMKDIDKSLGEDVVITVLVPADSLRKWGLPIVEYGSTEQAVRDIVAHLDKPPLNFIKKKNRHLVVVFRETAALHLRMNCDPDCLTVTGSVHYCPNWDRMAQGNPKRYGFMPGKLWIMLAAVVKQIHTDWDSLTSLKDLSPAIRLGVAAFNLYSQDGFGETNPFASIENALGTEVIRKLKKYTVDEKEFLLSSLKFDGTIADIGKTWRRIDSASCGFEPYSDDKLRKVVKQGVNAAFRIIDPSNPKGECGGATEAGKPWFPGYAIACPYLEFGDYKTVDDKEIASFLDLARVINKYLEDAQWDKPLSIAVFGPPGSGKSFAVKQILKALSPDGSDPAPLTFNMAQFSMVEQLTDAFHLVQDRALSGGGVPLVIFDEFDSDFDGSPMGWLKYFLAPMQDGLFRGQAQDYRVGRAIFLFSGGTAERFSDFQDKLKHDDEKRKQVKLSDFLSRLRGHLDVQSLNEREGDDESERRLIKIKRALFLRSLLMAWAKPILKPAEKPNEMVASIQDEVIDLFLNKWNYKHGVRSMEAVIQTSRWINGEYVLASLPAKTLLASHVVERQAS